MISFLRCSPSLIVLTAMASISEMARSKAASRTCGTNSIRDSPTSTSSMPRPLALALPLAVLGQGALGFDA